ncbi:hypothetical protein Tco_0491749 [Tanacetum coccineum]
MKTHIDFLRLLAVDVVASIAYLTETTYNSEPASDDPPNNTLEREHKTYASLFWACTSFPLRYWSSKGHDAPVLYVLSPRLISHLFKNYGLEEEELVAIMCSCARVVVAVGGRVVGYVVSGGGGGGFGGGGAGGGDGSVFGTKFIPGDIPGRHVARENYNFVV